MKFDKSKVYTAINADEIKIGSKGYFADDLYDLQYKVENDETDELHELVSIEDSSQDFRFKMVTHLPFTYNLFYLVEEPESTPKKVTAVEWDNRLRIMKVWNDDYSEARERRVVYIVPKEENVTYPVVSISPNITEGHIICYKHCAEIEETKEPETEKEKSYRPYNNADEFIADYKKRFCPDCKGVPAIWVKNVAGNLKQVVAITNDGVRLANKSTLVDYIALWNAYTYPDGSPCGMEE